MRFHYWCLATLGAGALVGCANISAKKVPVEERMAGADKEQGFRYYVPRPYVVVAKAIPFATTTEEAILIDVIPKSGNTAQLGLKVKSAEPGLPYRLYDRAGNPLNPDEWTEGKTHTRMVPLKPEPAPLPEPKSPSTPAPMLFAVTDAAGGGGSGDKPPDVPGLQVVMLPDFEEQLAIQNHTIAAHSTYDLHFNDGWQLDSVNGSWDATQVPIRVLQSITKLIKAAEALQLQAIGTPSGPSVPQTPPPHPSPNIKLVPVPTTVLITREYYLEPGIYRIQKSWERQPGHIESVNKACGLLTEMGLEVRQRMKFDLPPDK
jgi:hypothetical protein